ncbi:DUF998 domain-containing protein [Curtobacterium aurantiacum]|uniref:DUF998 domain-containing protein n=1 Tax=Curtobacterium aurantiacum TaxID=3236919 RepID=UPI001BDFA23C|nr:DUF998 domain-containing protein [Curtobacterium flaccumfaciens]MBT1677770.1 DUF998 domain-containing protein [Curtobacterium flaccumfaciens pv. flaccumfaciens]
MTTPTTTSLAPASRRATGTTRLGAALLILGTVQFLVMHLVVQSAWEQPRYSWWTNYISDLGAVHCAPVLGNDVCSPLHTGMNAAFITQGILLALGTILVSTASAQTGRKLAWPVMVVLSGLSWIIVGLIPEDVSIAGHSIGALPIFIVGNIALIVAGRSGSTRNRPVVRRSALVLGITGLLGFALTAIAIADPTGPVGIGIAERITVFPLQVWAIVAGISIFRRP